MAHKRPEKTSGNQDVIDAAFARKDGGAIPERAAGGSVPRNSKGQFKKGGVVPLKTGGKVVAPKLKEGGKVEGRKSGGRLDKFARGGACADKSPYSSAKLD
jgi:hypothetical protein